MSESSRAIFLKIGSTLTFALMLACIKLAAGSVPIGEIVFFRSAFALIPLLAMLAFRRMLAEAVKTSNPWAHARRGLFGVASMMLWFVSVQRLPLPEAMAINYAAPLVIVILGAIILHEKVRIYRSMAVAIGFLGIVVVLWPRFGSLAEGGLANYELIGAACGLASTVLMGLVAIQIRYMTATESTSSIVFYFSLTCSAVALMTAPFGWTVPPAGDAVLLVLCGLLGGVGQIMLTTAYRYAETSTIAPFEYVSIVWGTALGVLLFGEIPSLNVWMGGAIVIAAGIFIIYREHRLGLERRRMRKVATPQG